MDEIYFFGFVNRAFISGDFNGAGLTDDVEGLSHQDYIGLDEWYFFNLIG